MTFAVFGTACASTTSPSSISLAPDSPVSKALSLIGAGKSATYRAEYVVTSTLFRASQSLIVIQKPPRLAYVSNGITVFANSASSDQGPLLDKSPAVACNAQENGASTCVKLAPGTSFPGPNDEAYIEREQIRIQIENVANAIASGNPTGTIRSVTSSRRVVAGQLSRCLNVDTTKFSPSSYCFTANGIPTLVDTPTGTATLTSLSSVVDATQLSPPPGSVMTSSS